MSRIEKHSSEYMIAYGLDHVFGLFVQVFEKSKRSDEEDLVLVDMDIDKNPDLTVEKIVNIAEDYGFYIGNELVEKEIP